jgi:hypothetical protein
MIAGRERVDGSIERWRAVDKRRRVIVGRERVDGTLGRQQASAVQDNFLIAIATMKRQRSAPTC